MGITAKKLYHVKKISKKHHKVSSATISVKRQTAKKKRFPACLTSYTFKKMATKRTRVPTAILKITGVFFLKLQGFFLRYYRYTKLG